MGDDRTDEDAIASLKGMGLKNMEARVDKLDGEFQIDSGRGSGTTITVDIPLD